MAAEYLSNQLNEALRSFFVDDRDVCDSVLENPNGALATLSNRIDLAYLVGLVGQMARRELHLVRKIRNDFAHSYKPLHFSDTKIANRCREFRAYVLIPDESPRANFTRTVMGLLAVIHARLQSVTHARASSEGRLALSGDAAQRIKDRVKATLADLLAEASPGMEREALFSPEALESRKNEVWQLVHEMMSDASRETEAGADAGGPPADTQ